ncbi:N-acetylmuramoyl-L-alanine amidase [Oceanithermus desulfurans]|uniref:Uncharacterized protein n=2 Tax=Oceanithermus desulfurans TaxID=227924 RepID=A0A511RM43_9DEIN|nr:N-acetylmuramoyl-L-alanine amidase [Oceanithermus desulfurans]MBB6030061.1 hypothetical protein [Oceanithermus desulfurans]GEM90725.1 hypothetical protein ODE01S_21590 [Oceanithermus desulfurans NBRC 100063]
MRRALLLLILLLAAACSPGKPPPTQPPRWGEGDVSFERAAQAKSYYCNSSSLAAAPLEWSDPSALPDDPSQVLVILDPGHGGHYSGRGTFMVCSGNKKVEIDEDWVNLSLALRMQSLLDRAGFLVDLSRYGDYGPFDDKHGNNINANGCVTEALLGVHDKDVCEGPGVELNRRGRNAKFYVPTIEKLCNKHFPTAAEARACVERATYFDHKRNKPQSISRYGQIVRKFRDAGLINVPFNPDGANLVGSPRVALISLHFNDATDAGAIFASVIRGIGGGGSSILASNQAISKGSNPAAAVSRNLVTSTLEYMLRSLKDSQALSEAVNKHDLYYWDAGIVRNGAHAQEFDLHGRPGAVFIGNEHMKGKYQKPPKYAGPVTVASGLNPSYDENDQIKSIATDSTAITIPNTTLIEVGSYVDCENARALRRSLDRASVQKCYNNPPPGTACPPLDPTDPIDVAAEDIAHGLVEYYESYVPGFKQKACDNLRNSDWKDHIPDWCTSGGGGGADVPDIDDVRPASIEVDMWMTDGAANPPVEVSFSNVGAADLLATISTDSPVANIGPPDVYPASTAVPLGGSQSVRVPPGERARVEVGFQCTEVGDHTGSIEIRSNDPDEREVTIPMLVKCIAPEISVPVLPVPYITAINYIGMPNRDSWVLPDTFDFSEVGGVAPLDFQLETPSWLELKPEQGRLEPGESYSSYAARYTSKVYCGEAGEQEGEVVIRSSDPVNPVVQVPVRLLCPELEVTFSPETYDGWECPPLSGSIEVQNTPHLIELYTDVTSDAEGSILDVQYREPLFIYYPQNTPKYRLKRWPILHGDQGEDSEWSWPQYPHIPFTSWMNSCGYAALGDPEHVVEEFYLLHPRRNDSNQQLLPPFVAGLKSPSVFYTPVPFPGKIINITSYTAVGTFSIGNHPRQSYSLPPTGANLGTVLLRHPRGEDKVLRRQRTRSC